MSTRWHIEIFVTTDDMDGLTDEFAERLADIDSNWDMSAHRADKSCEAVPNPHVPEPTGGTP